MHKGNQRNEEQKFLYQSKLELRISNASKAMSAVSDLMTSGYNQPLMAGVRIDALSALFDVFSEYLNDAYKDDENENPPND